jgi:hypothetical protein
MKKKTAQLAILGGVLILAAQAHATLFDLTFSDQGGANAGTAALTVTDNNNGTFNVIGGTFQITAGALQGSYSLVPNLFAPSPVNTPTYANMYFTYDNQVTFPATPSLDWYGLMFSSGGANPTMVNLFANSATDYELVGTIYPYPNYPGSVDVHGMVTLVDPPAPVPEPATMLAGALLLLPFGASTFRIVRRHRK